MTGARAGLVAIVVGGGLLRAAALLHTPAFPVHVDEPPVVEVVEAVRTGKGLPPARVMYGGGYVLPLSAWVLTGRRIAAPGAVIRRDGPEAGTWYALARSWSALASTGAVALTGMAAWALGGPPAGLTAAAVVAVSPLAVREAQIAKPESTAACAVALALLALVRPWASRARRSVALGAAGGLVLATKLQVGLLPALLLGAALPPGAGRRLGPAGLVPAAAALVAVFLALDLHWVTHPRIALAYMELLRRALADTAWIPGGDTLPGPLAFHALRSLPYAAGPVAAWLAVPAVLLALRQGGRAALAALAVLGLWAALLATPVVFTRYFLPSLPALAVVFGSAAAALAARLPGARPRLVLAAVVVVVLAVPAGRSLALATRLAREDSRTLAGRWLAEHVPAGAVVVVWGAPARVAAVGAPPLPAEAIRAIRLPVEQWEARGVRWVVHHRYPLPLSSDPLPAVPAGFARVARFDPLGAGAGRTFEPIDTFYLPLWPLAGVERPGPVIDVYRRGP